MAHTGTYVLPDLENAPYPGSTDEHQANAGVPRITEPVRHPRILLVDDDPHTLEVQQRALRGMGYAFNSTASSGKEALLQLDHDPDSAELIVCDLGMPGMDGIEFLQTLNASPFRGSVILFSGESARVMHSVQRLLGGGHLTILGALTKPAPREAFRTLLECWRPHTTTQPKPETYGFDAADLAAATAEHQWVIHYQPQVDLKTGGFAGMEVLLRWNHPRYGPMYPGQFLALTDDSGAIAAITDRVVKEALEQQAIWRSEGLKVRLSLNLSMDSLQDPDFARNLTALVHDSGTAPQDITLEITETRIGSSGGIPLENLIRLRLARFRLAIDDFGTGHSSLSQLRDVPFTELKIDRGFVSGARHNQIIRPILEGSLGVAKRMGMSSVAEGIECLEDWQLLRELDCDLAQGSFIGRPMGAERVREWLLEWPSSLKLLMPS
jgi:EAL domain-containing protein (putative c-di-GMP-specific phosphodiesterase class I)/ActR/RegA family two-component response regulator